MPITLPNLDDRDFADLAEEARGLLVANAPALTNHNPSDPAITFMEVFAYFAEALLYRVNIVTDDNRRKFLRLLNGPTRPLPDSTADLDAEVRRTVLALRQTDRAVTIEDYEFLARAGDPANVARAHCVPERNLDNADPAERRRERPGHVSVVVVPFLNADVEKARTNVAAFLAPRRLLTAHVHVVGPRFVPVRVQVTIRLLPDASETAVRQRATAALIQFFDPVAGRGGGGWPLGRDVYVSEIYRLLDTIPGVDFVRPTRPEGASRAFDELLTKSDFAGRLTRSATGELISLALEEDELVQYVVSAKPDDPTATDLTIERPPMPL